ncbi:hypothetical protein OF83DRAFT_1089345 [Amylostereum chailletii]|nr:hypothetical protein OF83DRAFT_1089345 [Amylostereum chailletii]
MCMLVERETSHMAVSESASCVWTMDNGIIIITLVLLALISSGKQNEAISMIKDRGPRRYIRRLIKLMRDNDVVASECRWRVRDERKGAVRGTLSNKDESIRARTVLKIVMRMISSINYIM